MSKINSKSVNIGAFSSGGNVYAGGVVGYISGYEKVNVRSGVDELHIQLKYHEGTSVITEIYRVSTPGRRVYSSVRDLPRVYNGLGISIVSTPKGVMSDNEARKANVGGEILCQVF
jgi:small subunit ribosomal protein S8